MQPMMGMQPASVMIPQHQPVYPQPAYHPPPPMYQPRPPPQPMYSPPPPPVYHPQPPTPPPVFHSTIPQQQTHHSNFHVSPQPQPQQQVNPTHYNQNSANSPVTPKPPNPAQNSKTVVTIKGKKCSSSMCHTCGEETGVTTTKKVGFVAVVWCLVLSSVFLCFIPLCSDKCKDTIILCP